MKRRDDFVRLRFSWDKGTKGWIVTRLSHAGTTVISRPIYPFAF